MIIYFVTSTFFYDLIVPSFVYAQIHTIFSNSNRK